MDRINIGLTSSSPWAFWFACSSNLMRWSNGSFNSVYALQISFLHTKASKRSQRPGYKRLVTGKFSRTSSTYNVPVVLGKRAHHFGMT